MQKKQLPEIGKEYHFFDDGKVGPSRHYIARVEKLIPYNDFYATKIKTNEDEERLLDMSTTHELKTQGCVEAVTPS